MSIKLTNVTYTYMKNTPYERTALSDINLEITEGEFVGIIGHTGSGKSTLVQHLNGLLKPSLGTVEVDGININVRGKEAQTAKREVGMVFQYPEHQLFEETVYDDIAFGPRNFGIDEQEVQQRVRKAMTFVGLDFERFAKRSPFNLSGGQMRRVAIAGVIALEPKYLVLDEPSAGLDPKGRDEIFGQVINLHRTLGTTIIVVSHNMDEIAKMATRLIVMKQGRVVADGAPRQIFTADIDLLSSAGLGMPSVTLLMREFKQAGLEVDEDVLTAEQAAQAIYKAIRGRKTKCLPI